MKKDKCWRFYVSPQAMTCLGSSLGKDERLGYFGKLTWSKGATKDTLELFDHTDTQKKTGKKSVLTMTLKKEGKMSRKSSFRAWKVRANNTPGVIYRSVNPTYDSSRKVWLHPAMGFKPQDSIKNVVIAREDIGAVVRLSTGSGVELGAGAARAAKDAELRSLQARVLSEVGKTGENTWDVRVKQPWSPFQSFGLAVSSLYAT